MTGFVYFMQAERGSPIKVGYSVNPLSRLRSLNTASPMAMRVLASVPGTKDDESALQDWLSAYRLNGEWFRAARVVLGCVAKVRRRGVRSVVPERAPKSHPVGALHRWLRKECQTPADLAGRMGVSAEAVRLWGEGNRIPRHDYMVALATLTGGEVVAADFYMFPAGQKNSAA